MRLESLSKFWKHSCYEKYFQTGANAKLGLTTMENEDSAIYSDLLKIIRITIRFHGTFVTLADGLEQSEADPVEVDPEFSKVAGLVIGSSDGRND